MRNGHLPSRLRSMQQLHCSDQSEAGAAGLLRDPGMKTLTETIDQALWRRDLSGRPFPERLTWGIARHIYAVSRDLLSGQLTLRAMSLVYTTLLSAVPLLALSFSVIKIFGVHNRLQPQLYRLMEPLGAKGVDITDWVIRAIDNLEGGVLGTLSLVFLVYTAIAMVQKVESTFNYVWHVTHTRNLARRVSEYLSVLLIGPVVMTFALGLIASVGANSIVQALKTIEPFGSAIVVLGQVLPYILVIAVFTFLYKFLPNAAVRFGAALTGGIAAGVMWAFVGSLFASVVALSASQRGDLQHLYCSHLGADLALRELADPADRRADCLLCTESGLSAHRPAGATACQRTAGTHCAEYHVPGRHGFQGGRYAVHDRAGFH